MAESTDKKTRKIAEKRVEPGKEFEGYQEAQNQLLAIQAEQQQNLALQANDAMNVQQQNQTLAQAAEVMAMDNLNPATQGILAGYGLNQPRVIKQSNTQRQGPNNITINNTTINNTSGPVQGREISIRPQEAGQSKFRAWLTNVFARQDAQWQKQNQEYARRESSLTRNSNKMMRKIEGLGKEIGNAVDPRKQAQRAQNSTMNLLKALGLVYFAKKLPDILGFFNNAEEKVRGWIGEIGNKIKEGISSAFSITGDEGIFSKLIHELYNEEETGILNRLFKDIGNWISERADYAREKTGSLTGFLGLPDGEQIIKWLELFLGGPAASVSITKKQVLEKIRKEEFEDKMTAYGSEEQGNFMNYVNMKLYTQSSSRFGVSKTDGSLTPDSFVGTSYKGVRDEWGQWKKDHGIGHIASDEDASKFFKEKGYAYTAEAYILLKSTWELKSGRIFSTKLDAPLGTLPPNTVYPQLAASLEIIREYKKGVRTSNKKWGTSSTNAIFYLLDLLMKKANTLGHVTVFEEFLKCIASEKTILKLKEEGLIKEREYKLVMEPMTPLDQDRFMTSDRILMSKYYKKLVPINGRNKAEALTLAETDYRNNSGAKKWTFIEISSEGLGKILEETTGSKTIDFDRDQKRNFMNSFRANSRAINNGVDFGDNYFNFDDDSDEFQEFFEATQEKREYDKAQQERREQRLLEKSSEEAEEFLNSKNTDFVIEEQHEDDAKYGMPAVNMSEDTGLRLGGKPDPVTGKTGPAVVRHVTNAFGGTGSLTSNYKERREYGITEKNRKVADNGKEYRYHYGVDLDNSEGGDVRFPANGTIKSSTYISKKKDGSSHIDINNGDGTTTIFRHTKLADRFIDKDGKPIAGAEILPGEVIGTSEYYPRGAHIHLEVRNNKGECINPLNYFKPKLKDLKTTYQPETRPNTNRFNPNNRSANGNYRPNGTTGIDISLDQTSDVIYPDSIIPVETETTESSISQSQSRAMAENMTPAERENRSPENNSEILLARCADGIDYIAETMAPLSEVINGGNMMVAEAVSKSGGLTNLTPHEPQLEMNQV